MQCSSCGTQHPMGAAYCPTCGARTSYNVSNSGISPYDPTAASSSPGAPQHKPATEYGSPPHGAPQQKPYGPSDSYGGPLQAPPPPAPARTRLIIGILIGIIIVLLVLNGIIGALAFSQRLGVTQANATPTGQAQANTTATAQAQANVDATATAAAVSANLPASACKYNYWQTGTTTNKTLTNFGVPQTCVLVLDSFRGSLNGVSWANGGVMAFPPGVYSGDIFNGEYEIVPEKANPNPKQVFCNRVLQVTSHGYAFSQVQPLPAWGLSGPQIVVQGHC